ncbi:MAG: hypothetical protein V8R17_11355 [Blautia obeum]
MAKEAALTMLEILSKTPPFSYMDIPKHRERIERVFTADNALKYVEFAIKPMNSLPFEKFQNMLMRVMLHAIPLYAGIWLTPLRNTKRRCLILQNNRTETKHCILQRALRKMFGHLFPTGVFYHRGQCLDVYPEQFRSVYIGHPSRRKSCEAGQADALCILCRDVPV